MRADEALCEHGIRSIGVTQIDKGKVCVLFRAQDIDAVQKNDPWIETFAGACLYGEQWHSLKTDRVRTGICLRHRGLYYFERVYMEKREEREALIQRRIMEQPGSGESAYIRVFEHIMYPVRCYQRHQYGHQRFRCKNDSE
jgi:hypothetical protein